MALENIRSQSQSGSFNDVSEQITLYLAATKDNLVDILAQDYLKIPNLDGIVPADILGVERSVIDIQLLAYHGDCIRVMPVYGTTSDNLVLKYFDGMGVKIQDEPSSSITLSSIDNYVWGSNNTNLRVFNPNIKYSSCVKVFKPVGDYVGRIQILNVGDGYIDLFASDKVPTPEVVFSLAIFNYI